MASNRDMDNAFTNLSSSSSSLVTFSDHLDSFLNNPSSLIGSAFGSFQNEGLLGSSSDSAYMDADFGFSRPDLRKTQLVGTIEFYQRHVFLCYENPKTWPPYIEYANFNRLPRLLYAAFMARKGDMKYYGH